MRRSRVVIPGRFARSTSALRYEAVVTARALAEAVLRAGGEPLTLLPSAPGGSADDRELAGRLELAEAVLLPGGGDVAPARYGEHEVAEQVYGVHDEQDAFDLAVARLALDRGVPLLAICRGVQVVNVALGGTLVQHMAPPHQPLTHEVRVVDGTGLAEVLRAAAPSVSCSHHQCLRRLGDGLAVTATAVDGTIEAVERPEHPGWFLGIQWHPEDTAADDRVQQAPFDALVAAARAG